MKSRKLSAILLSLAMILGAGSFAALADGEESGGTDTGNTESTVSVATDTETNSAGSDTGLATAGGQDTVSTDTVGSVNTDAVSQDQTNESTVTVTETTASETTPSAEANETVNVNTTETAETQTVDNNKEAEVTDNKTETTDETTEKTEGTDEKTDAVEEKTDAVEENAEADEQAKDAQKSEEAKDGEAAAEDKEDAEVVKVDSFDVKAEVDGTLYTTLADAIEAAGEEGTVNILGGTFTDFAKTIASDIKLTIMGGTFNQDPFEYVAEGYTVIENEDGTYSVTLKEEKKNATVEIVKFDSYEDEDYGYLRAITEVGFESGTVEYYGTWFIPEDLMDEEDNDDYKVVIRYDESDIESGDTFAADLMGIPKSDSDRGIAAVSFIKLVEGDEVETDAVITTVNENKNETSY